MPREPRIPRLKLFLLGRFAVEYDGAPVPASAWKRRRPVELLTALALAPDHVLHREEIIDRLWPDKPLDSGANNLYRTLHDLRRITGDDVVRVERGAVRLHESTWVDVAAFEHAASGSTPAELVGAFELYGGPLLPDDPYSELIEPRRVGLRQRFIDTTLRIARLGDAVDADRRIAVLRRLLEVEPTLEEGHRQLMIALAEQGRIADADAQFLACADALRERLDTTPSDETRQLHQRIKAGKIAARAAAPASAPVATPATEDTGPVRDDHYAHVAKRLLGQASPTPLRGRTGVREAVEAFATSERGALLVIGEAGAGKTRLGVECARQCAAEGAIVLAGLGCEFEGAAPYTPFVDAWADLIEDVGDHENPFLAFVPRSGASAQEDRLRLFNAVEQSLVELAGQGRVCLLVEDLHQADESSLQLFHHLARATRHLPLQLIGTLREEEIHVGNPLHVLLGSLERERTTRKIALERLDKDATRELVADVWDEEPDAHSVEVVFRLAAGNPFFTEQIAAAMLESDLESTYVPTRDVMAAVRGRMTRLGPDAERLLLAASVQGVRFDFEVARAAAGLDPEPALDALDRTLSARLVEEQGPQYRFRHALMRASLYDSLTSARRVFLHRGTAAALEAASGRRRLESELLAFHHQEAGNLEAALPHVLKAITNAQSRLGFGEAVVHCQRALELLSTLGHPPGPQQYRLLRDMGGMRVALGDLDLAIENLDAAAELRSVSPPWTPDPVQRCHAKRLAALALIEAGHLDEAEAHLDDALRALGTVEDTNQLCNLYYLYSQLRWHQSRHEEAFDLAKRCLAVAEKADDEEAIAKGYEMLALACHSLGEWKQGREYEEQRKRIADGALDVASAFDVHL